MNKLSSPFISCNNITWVMYKAKNHHYKFEGGIYSWDKIPLSYPKIFLSFHVPKLCYSQNTTWHIPRASKNSCIINLRILENTIWLFNYVCIFPILSSSNFCLYSDLPPGDKRFSKLFLIHRNLLHSSHVGFFFVFWIFTLVDVNTLVQVFSQMINWNGSLVLMTCFPTYRNFSWSLCLDMGFHQL